MSERNQKHWRELCSAVSNERDSKKLNLLVQELIAALDEHERNPSPSAIPESDNQKVAVSSS
jgi:hypothetical protein